MIKMKAFTVTEITRYLKRLMQTDPILNHVLVEGEISNFTRHSSGHCYFTLKDDSSKISCVLFAQHSSESTQGLKNGDKIHAKGQISLFERDGKYQLYVHSIENIGLGALHIKFGLLKEKLSKLGYFEEARKKAIPEFARSIGVVTSPTGAAIQDIISVANRRSNYSELFVYPVRVQGQQSAEEIVKGIDYFNRFHPVDVLILARGGGSLEELWSFNEEIVAHAIVNSKIPIITGIGHETDFTISDFVADHRAPTPSAAAEIAVKSKEEIRIVLNKSLQQILVQLNRRIELSKLKLDRFNEAYMKKKLISSLVLKQDQVDTLKKHISKSIFNDFQRKEELLLSYGRQINALSPLKTMERGFSLVQKEGSVVTHIESLNVGDPLKITLVDGTVDARVERLEDGWGQGGRNGDEKS